MDENLTAPQKLKGIIAEITGMGGAALGSIFGGFSFKDLIKKGHVLILRDNHNP